MGSNSIRIFAILVFSSGPWLGGCSTEIPEDCQAHIESLCSLCADDSYACTYTRDSVDLGKRNDLLTPEQCNSDLRAHESNVALLGEREFCEQMNAMGGFNNAR